MNRIVFFSVILTLFFMSAGFGPLPQDKKGVVTSIGKPAEGTIKPFIGEPYLKTEFVFTGKSTREPYLGVAVNGSILIMQNYEKLLRRSEDGGNTWSDPVKVPFGFRDSNFITDENTGDILVISLWENSDKVFRSRDNGKTWSEEKIVLKPNEVMKWIEQAKLKNRSSMEGHDTDVDMYFMHNNAGESGITLRHGPFKGRLIVTGTFRPHAKEHPSDRKPLDNIYSCAMYSDDGGKTWQVSGLFPEGVTEEATLAELSDGTIYYNTRSCTGFYDKAYARKLEPEDDLRREAWSSDGGNTWENLRVNRILPDGGGYNRGYGLKAGLVRLPVKGRDILIYSNDDTGGGDREKLTIWASFDGGQTWPVKRLLNPGPSAYSSMGVARPGTPGEGTIYLLFEGGPDGHYSGMQFARFNLSWILAGEKTGDGNIPDWITKSK
jgi:sialidase-1